MMAANDIKGILVGSDDHITEGYKWITQNEDWDNGCINCTNKIDEYKNTKDFHIYFYVYKDKTKNGTPAHDFG